MKKFTITVISLFMVLLISLSAVGEAMGTSSKYASNQDYIQSENLALRDKSNKMTDGKDSSVCRFKTRNGGESIIDLGESCDFNSVILKEKGLNVQKFSISVSDDNENFTQIYANDKIEFHRLCTFDTVKARYVKLTVEKSDNLPKIREMEIYNAVPEKKNDFRVSTYSTLGGSVFGIIDDTTLSDAEKDAKIKELIDADYYDTVTDYIDIGNVRWDEEGIIHTDGWDGIERDEDKYYAVMMRNLHEVLDEKGVNLVITILNPSGENGNQRVMKSITENRDTLITNMIAFANKYEFDGIDIDWEYPGTSLAGIASDRSDKENYTLLLAELRKTLDTYREGMLVTTAVGGDVYFALQTDMKEASRYLDYVQLMTYDLQGGFQKVTGHHAALYHSEGNLFDACVEKAVNGFANAGVPMEKLILGVPFYSRKWDGVKGAGCRNGLGMEAETVGGYGGDYGELKESWIGKRGFIRYWDEQAKGPYLFDGETFISYEDCESLGVKIAYLKEKGMGGIMFWEYKCDPSGELLSFIKKNM